MLCQFRTKKGDMVASSFFSKNNSPVAYTYFVHTHGKIAIAKWSSPEQRVDFASICLLHVLTVH